MDQPKKPQPAPRGHKSQASIAKIDASVEAARGSPGFELVRAIGEVAKLGPYKIGRPFNVKMRPQG